jgi:hypothetical protein
MQTTITQNARRFGRTFPPFSLSRLLKTVFAPKGGERICILIDLEDPSQAKDFAFLKNPDLTIQRHAIECFYKGLQNGVLAELGSKAARCSPTQSPGEAISTCRMRPSRRTAHGSSHRGRLSEVRHHSLHLDLLRDGSADGFAKQYGFRGATLHGVNQVILNSGLAVDYNEVSRLAEKLRLGMTRAESVEIDYVFDDQTFSPYPRARRSGGAEEPRALSRRSRCRESARPGEIYYVPAGPRAVSR